LGYTDDELEEFRARPNAQKVLAPEKICPALMPVMTRMMWLIQERIYEGLEPRPTFYWPTFSARARPLLICLQ
jgi:hypothetical protein